MRTIFPDHRAPEKESQRRLERICEARQRTRTGLEALDRIEYVDAGIEEVGAGNCKERER